MMKSETRGGRLAAPASKETWAKPFLKWAGGKGRLIGQLNEWFPPQLKRGGIQTYHEPFAGGAAVFFYVKQMFGVPRAILSDINPEIILVYKVAQRNGQDLMDALDRLSRSYLSRSPAAREQYYYTIRTQFNSKRSAIRLPRYSRDWISRAAEAIFLNRTCYNGLFRVNRRGEFNVPFGRYTHPLIFDEVNLQRVSALLDGVQILLAPFEAIGERVSGNSFVYFDPPYHPMSRTARFTSYSRGVFDEGAQRRLAESFLALAARRNVWVMLSNSDTSDRFIRRLYRHPGITIGKVEANRMINSDADRRGKIPELIITNYAKPRPHASIEQS